MKKICFYLLTLLSFLSVTPSLAVTISSANGIANCPGLFESKEQIAGLRAEILASNKLDQISTRSGAWLSNFIENRAKDIDSSLVRGSHIVSLGSGPDIYLPLYLYPMAKYFHLVDLLGKWGTGPDQVIEEIEARLHSISSSAVVDRLDKLGDWREIKGVLSEPLIWRVNWNSPSSGNQEKIFFLHQLDFEKIESLKKIKSFFSLQAYRASLGGVLVTGTSANLETRRFLLSELQTGGSMFTEMLYTDNNGQTSSPDDQVILQELASDFDVLDLGLVEIAYRFTPRRYFISPKK